MSRLSRAALILPVTGVRLTHAVRLLRRLLAVAQASTTNGISAFGSCLHRNPQCRVPRHKRDPEQLCADCAESLQAAPAWHEDAPSPADVQLAAG